VVEFDLQPLDSGILLLDLLLDLFSCLLIAVEQFVADLFHKNQTVPLFPPCHFFFRMPVHSKTPRSAPGTPALEGRLALKL
jgi:hypothetical protein